MPRVSQSVQQYSCWCCWVCSALIHLRKKRDASKKLSSTPLRSKPAHDRLIDKLKQWAARQVEKRLRAEWEQYRRDPQTRFSLFRRGKAAERHVTRSLLQINFYRDR